MIPSQAHFIWFGESLPFAYAIAIRSAATRGAFERVILHHDHDLSHDKVLWQHLQTTSGFESRLIDRKTLPISGELTAPLQRLYDVLEKPAARANLWRAALLFDQGGVYLDTDTVTLADMSEIRAFSGAFCGVEPVALPGYMRQGYSATQWGAAALRLVGRDLCRRAPRGWRAFRRIEPWFCAAPNNAVVGAEAGHAFMGTLLERMLRVPKDRQKVRFALGTHLLQEHVAAHLGMRPQDAFSKPIDDHVLVNDFALYSAPYFYPVGPEISQHWFRQNGAQDLDGMIDERTVVVHWYASVRTSEIVPKISPEFIENTAEDIAFSALAKPFL